MANHPGRAPRAPMVDAKADLKPLGRVIRMLFQDYPAMLIAVMACIIISAVVGILPAIYIETITSYIEDGLRLGWDGVSGKILHALVTMVCIYLAGLACTAVYTQLMAHVTQGFLHKLRTRMFAGMQKLPIRYFDQNSRGDIMSYYTNDIDTLRQLVSQSLPQLFAAGLTVIGLLGLVLYFSIPRVLIVFLGIFCMTKVTKNVGGRSAKYFLSQQKSLGKVEGYIEEMMNGQKVVKVFCHEEAAERDFDAINEQLFSDANHAQRYANIFMPIMGNIGNILYVLTAFLGGVLICSGGNIPNLSFQNLFETGSMLAPLKIAVVASFLGMTKQFTGNVSQVSQQINAIVMAAAGASRVFELIDQQPEEDNGHVTLIRASEAADGTLTESAVRTGVWAWKHTHQADGSVDYVELKGNVVFDGVDFGYNDDKIVLHDVKLYAEPGQKIAFVGSTGAGKTTITNLINRFYDIQDGKIRYDGININKIKKADLRHSLGIVLQDTHLFTGTVKDNIRFGKLDATDEEIIAAAKLANADGFIRRLPEGYDTVITGDGANLSQGQRQLLAIARAAVADPPVLILDEATSSIDTRTERIIQESMDRLMHGRTTFVIAHRLSTVRNSDCIMVLEQGRIIERGTHDQLIEEKGKYYQLYTGNAISA